MMYKNIFLLLIIAIFSASMVLAVGIGEYTKQKEFLIEPGKEVIYKFYVFDSQLISTSVEGTLAEYVTLNDPNPGGGPRTVEMIMNFPSDVEPGTHTIYLVATEIPQTTGTVGGIASVRTGIRAVALYPGKYPIFIGMDVSDVNVNEKAPVTLSVTNYGRETIIETNGTVIVYDADNNTIINLTTNTVPIWPYESKSLKGTIDTAEYNLTPGIYKAVASVTYDGVPLNVTKEDSFIIGELKVNIIDSTKEVYLNSTNKYRITIESDWTGTINDVYARIETPNGESLKTPSVDMEKPGDGKKASATLETYWETNGLDVGTYYMDVTLHYKGESNTQRVPVNIIEGKAPDVEKPNTVMGLSLTGFIILLSVIILLPLAIYFYMRLERSKKHDDIIDVNNTQISDDDIKPPSL